MFHWSWSCIPYALRNIKSCLIIIFWLARNSVFIFAFRMARNCPIRGSICEFWSIKILCCLRNLSFSSIRILGIVILDLRFTFLFNKGFYFISLFNYLFFIRGLIFLRFLFWFFYKLLFESLFVWVLRKWVAVIIKWLRLLRLLILLTKIWINVELFISPLFICAFKGMNIWLYLWII